MKTVSIFLAIIAIAAVGFVNANDADTIFTFTFHDTFVDGKEMAEHLDQCNWKGTWYISALRLCLHPDYLQREDVNELFLNGHQVGGHGLSHAKSFDLSPEQLELQFCCNRELLKQYKWRPTTMAYPHGQYNHTIRRMAQHCGNCNALHVGGLKATESCLDCPTAESIPPEDKWKIKSYSVRGTDTLEDLVERVERAMDDTSMSKKWVVFNFHKLCDPDDAKCTSYTHYTLKSVFSRFVQFLKGQESAGNVSIKTVKSVMHLDSTFFPVPRSASIPFDSDRIELDTNSDSGAATLTFTFRALFLVLVGCVLF